MLVENILKTPVFPTKLVHKPSVARGDWDFVLSLTVNITDTSLMGEISLLSDDTCHALMEYGGNRYLSHSG